MHDMETIDGVEYLTVAEVAQEKGAKPDTVRVALNRGTLTGTKLLGRWLIKPADAREWTPGGWGGVDRFKKGGEE
jgi:predicted transcriptional regulator of viral defense system